MQQMALELKVSIIQLMFYVRAYQDLFRLDWIFAYNIVMVQAIDVY